MAALVQLQPSARCFHVEGKDSVLEAALQAGLSLNYGCSNGNCGLCRARLIEGTLSKVRPHDFVFTEAEKNQGYFLLCSYTAVDDIVVEASEDAAIPQQQIATRVKKVSALRDDILLLQIQTPRSQRLRFHAGQSVQLQLDDGFAGWYPIASCPCDDRNIQFHVPVTRDDALSQRLAKLKTNDLVRVTGPEGDFFLKDDSKQPLLFLAIDTGFAPIKSLIEHAMQLEIEECVHLYWCVFGANRHYMGNLVRSWTDAFDNFSCTLFGPEDLETKRRSNYDPPGLPRERVVEMFAEHIIHKHPELPHCDIYIAGPAPTPSLTMERLTNNGVPRRRLKSLTTP